jgi:hypothetical protein
MLHLTTPIRRALTGTLLATSAWLTACGGGATDEDTRPTPAAETTRQRPLYTISDSDTITGLAASLLPYIEQSHAAYFPGQAETYTLGPYTYRCYAATANCVGYTANDLYAFGPVVGRSTGAPVWVSSMRSFCDANPAACGLKLHRTLDIGGLTRHFTVHLPWKARGRTNTPVVFMLHGTSGTGDEFYNHSGWREKADAEGFGAPAPRPMSMILVVGSMDDRYTDNLGSPLPMTDQCNGQVFANRMQGLLGTLSLAATPCSWQEARLYGQRMSIHLYTGSTATPAASNRLYSVVVEGLTHSYPNYMPDALWSYFRPHSLP